MKNVLASELMESLMDAGFTTDQVEEYFAGFDHAIFTPTSSQQVLGVMNDLKMCYPVEVFAERLKKNQTSYKILDPRFKRSGMTG